MAGSFSDYLENEILDHVFGGATLANQWTPPTNVFIRLYTVTPDLETGAGGTEVTGNNYAPVQVANTDAEWGAAVGGAKSNRNTIAFPQATPAGWGTIVAWGAWTAATAGNFLGGSDQTPNKVVDAEDRLEFAPGDLDITLT